VTAVGLFLMSTMGYKPRGGAGAAPHARPGPRCRLRHAGADHRGPEHRRLPRDGHRHLGRHPLSHARQLGRQLGRHRRLRHPVHRPVRPRPRQDPWPRHRPYRPPPRSTPTAARAPAGPGRPRSSTPTPRPSTFVFRCVVLVALGSRRRRPRPAPRPAGGMRGLPGPLQGRPADGPSDHGRVRHPADARSGLGTGPDPLALPDPGRDLGQRGRPRPPHARRGAAAGLRRGLPGQLYTTGRRPALAESRR
jgi:hypothetical protein